MSRRSREKFTADEMIEAIKKNNGILAKAAQGLGCNRQTVSNYINRYPTVKAAFDEANETNIDFVESKLMQNINAGDTTAIIFFLKTKAKARGYVERTETLNRNIEIDLSKLTNEQLDRVANGEDPMKVILDGYIASTQSES